MASPLKTSAADQSTACANTTSRNSPISRSATACGSATLKPSRARWRARSRARSRSTRSRPRPNRERLTDMARKRHRPAPRKPPIPPLRAHRSRGTISVQPTRDEAQPLNVREFELWVNQLAVIAVGRAVRAWMANLRNFTAAVRLAHETPAARRARLDKTLWNWDAEE